MFKSNERTKKLFKLSCNMIFLYVRLLVQPNVDPSACVTSIWAAVSCCWDQPCSLRLQCRLRVHTDSFSGLFCEENLHSRNPWGPPVGATHSWPCVCARTHSCSVVSQQGQQLTHTAAARSHVSTVVKHWPHLRGWLEKVKGTVTGLGEISCGPFGITFTVFSIVAFPVHQRPQIMKN